MPFENIPGGGTIVTGEADIRKVQYAAIQSALTLQVRTGLKHSRNAPPDAARAILSNAGIKPKRTIKGLLEQFYKYRKSIDPLAIAPDLAPRASKTT